MVRDEKLDAKINQVMAKLPSAEEFLGGWPTHRPRTRHSVQGTASFIFQEFTAPQVLLSQGISRAGSIRVAWCLWSTAGIRPVADGRVPVEIPATLSDPARRALQLLAADQRETEESAATELADIEVAREVAQLAMIVRPPASENDAMAADFGATVHAVLPGTDDVDVICLGTPMWIRRQERHC